jgi:hypothetical protein
MSEVDAVAGSWPLHSELLTFIKLQSLMFKKLKVEDVTSPANSESSQLI